MNVGGTANYINTLVSRLPDYGYTALLATGQVEDHEVEAEIDASININRITGLRRKISVFNDVKARIALNKLIKEYQPDLIHTHTFKAGFLVRSLKIKIPVIHTFHGHLFDEPELSGWKTKVIQIIEKQLAKKTSIIITVGERVGEQLLQRSIGRSAQFRSIAPGITPLNLVSRQSALSKLELKDDLALYVVWLARVTKVKGPDRVVELAEKFPNVIFLVAGGGDLLDSLRKFESNNLKFLGWQAPEVMWSIADLAISTSHNEGMPISLIEAQQAGVPVVAVDVGSVAEVVDSGQTGYVVDKFDESYLLRLKVLIDDDRLRVEMGKEAKRQATAKFTIERMLDSHDNAYREALPNSSI
jgi:glycosyltransferase involved in cell wall biosynthesis